MFSQGIYAYFYVIIHNLPGGRANIICPVFAMRNLGHRIELLGQSQQLIKKCAVVIPALVLFLLYHIAASKLWLNDC